MSNHYTLTDVHTRTKAQIYNGHIHAWKHIYSFLYILHFLVLDYWVLGFWTCGVPLWLQSRLGNYEPFHLYIPSKRIKGHKWRSSDLHWKTTRIRMSLLIVVIIVVLPRDESISNVRSFTPFFVRFFRFNIYHHIYDTPLLYFVLLPLLLPHVKSLPLTILDPKRTVFQLPLRLRFWTLSPRTT